MQTATASQIYSIIEDARNNNGFVAISDYVSESGRVADVTIQPLGPTGYLRLIKESIAAIDNGDIVRPDWIDAELWDKAVTSQVASWVKTLNNEHNRRNGYSQESKGMYSHDRDDSEDTAVYIRNLVIISKTVKVEGEYGEDKRRPLTVAKAFIRNAAPVGKYQGNFKLRRGYFSRLAWDNHVVEGEGALA
jgi:hypothetical protein